MAIVLGSILNSQQCSEEAIELMNYDVFNLLNAEIAFLVVNLGASIITLPVHVTK